ncbi:hypothetical protein M9435_003073 [Picochlorum sp. BPE23]|nr:hypothetical protein M9435_003073 [Picochlorum sp. BPE23]
MPEKIRYTREALLAFRHLPATKKLPKDLDVDVLRALTEASFFDTGAVGVTGQPRPPLRSRLIHDEATSSSGNGTIPRVVTPMADRWDAGKKSVQYGGGKGGVTSPSGKHGTRGGGTSRWVKMEEEESWRRKSDDGDMPTPRYAWNDANIMAQRAHDDDEKTPEWATLNPNQKIQITADAIEAERQKMQAAWRKEKKKEEESGEVEEVQNDEIEMWKREQEEHDRAEAEAGYQGRGHEQQQQQHVSASTSAPKGQPVNLAQLFGAGGSAAPPGQGMNPTQITGSTSDQQAMLLAAQMRQARLNGEPPASSASSSQQQAKNLLAMLHHQQQQQQQQRPQQAPPPGYQQQPYQQQQQQQGRGMPMMMGMPPPPQSPGTAGGMPMRPSMAQYSMPMPPPPGHPGMPPPPHMMPPPPNMMMMRPPPPGFSPGMMPQQQQQQQQQQQIPGVRPGQPVNIAALFGSNTAAPTGGTPQ